MSTKTIEGVGFCVSGYEDNYLVLIDKNGNESNYWMTDLCGFDVRENKYCLLSGQYGDYEDVFARNVEDKSTPTAYRVSITITTEQLSENESKDLLDAAKNKRNNSRRNT